MKKSNEIDTEIIVEKPKSNEEKFQEMLDESINPLVMQTMVKLEEPNIKKQEVANFLGEIFAIALLEGVKLSESTMAELDRKNQMALKNLNPSKMQQALQKSKDTRSAAAKLSVQKGGMMKDGTPRFVAPEDINPITGEYKK